MKFILVCNTVGSNVRELIPLAQAAEAAGFDAIMLGDHVVMPAQLDASAPYTKDGKSPMDFDTPWPDCITMMTAIALSTTTLRVMSSIFILPLRHPLPVAKAINTAAILSGDRLVLGVGAGWLKEEFDILGMPFESRGARTSEAIQIIREIGEKGQIEWHGTHYDIPLVSAQPQPDRPVPIYVGGESDAALARAATLGDGYLSTMRRSTTLIAHAARLREMRASSSRAGAPFEFVGIVADANTAEEYAGLEGSGIDSVGVLPWKALSDKADVPLGEKLAGIRRFGETVIAVMP